MHALRVTDVPRKKLACISYNGRNLYRRVSRLKMACAACGGRWYCGASELGEVFYSLTTQRKAHVYDAVIRLVCVHTLSCMRLLGDGCRHWGLPKDIHQMAHACRKRYPLGVIVIHLNLRFCCIFTAGGPRRLCLQCGVHILRRGLAVGLAKLGDEIFSMQLGRKRKSLNCLLAVLVLRRSKLLV